MLNQLLYFKRIVFLQGKAGSKNLTAKDICLNMSVELICLPKNDIFWEISEKYLFGRS